MEWIDSNDKMPPNDRTVVLVEGIDTVFMGLTLHAINARDFRWVYYDTEFWKELNS